jgi:hypothetical protein
MEAEIRLRKQGVIFGLGPLPASCVHEQHIHVLYLAQVRMVTFWNRSFHDQDPAVLLS